MQATATDSLSFPTTFIVAIVLSFLQFFFKILNYFCFSNQQIKRKFISMKRCVRCFVHGDMLSHAPKNCERKKCGCRKCELVDIRRGIKNQLDQMRKKQRANLGLPYEKEASYTCLRCRYHGVKAAKKFHSPCPYSMCRCNSCVLIEERTRIEKELTRLQRREKISDLSTARESPDPTPEIQPNCEEKVTQAFVSANRSQTDEISIGSSNSSLSGHDIDETPLLSPEAQIILGLITAISEDPTSVNPDNFDVNAISNLLSLPTFDLPLSWLNEWPNINYLLGESLKRFQI